MSRLSKVAVLIGAVAVVMLAGVLLGWLGTKRSPGGPQATPAQPPLATLPSNQSPMPPVQPAPPTNKTAELAGNPPAVMVSAAATNGPAEWETKLDDILAGEGEASEKAQRLFELFPQLPKDGQVEVAQHLSNLVADKDYAPLGKMLADSKQPEPVLDVLMGDILNRPNSIKLPELLDIARDPEHPKASEAKELLGFYLDQDFGSDWTKWQARMEQWLKDNPD